MVKFSYGSMPADPLECCALYAHRKMHTTHTTPTPLYVLLPLHSDIENRLQLLLSRSEAMLHDHTVDFLHHSSLPEIEAKLVAHEPLPNNVILRY